MEYLKQKELSPGALELVAFDKDSINQFVLSQHAPAPEVWLADPDEYEKNGRPLRDSASSRLLAYSLRSRMVYATDGCNSCARRVDADLESLPETRLVKFAEENELRPDLLRRLSELAREQRPQR